MKNKYIASIAIAAGLTVWGGACSDSFLDQNPRGSYSAPSLANLKGVEGMLIATYSALDGSWFESWDNNHFNQNGGASNWVWGSIRGGDAYRGTEPLDGVDIGPIERHQVQPSNPVLMNKWNACYDGIGKANTVLSTLSVIRDDISAADAARIEGEARFLRGHFHFEALKTFGKAPFVDETVTDFASVKNDQMIWTEIEEDFQFAYDNLPSIQTAAGRANKWAAGSYLAKAYIYQAKWGDAKAVLDDVIANGVTAAGTPYELEPLYSDNFRADAEVGNSESIFAYEASVNDGSISNGNYENTLNMPHGSASRAACCGFFQPSQNLVNSFKTDAAGLPMPDTYNDVDVTNDDGIEPTDPFTPYAGNLDPRLDWTVGRRGIPFLDWGVHPGRTYIRDYEHGGPYSPIKNVPRISDFDGTLAGVFDWGFTLSALNVHIIRYADVLLWAAEAEAELGNLAEATELVNMVRERAANPDGFVKFEDGTDAANYVIGLYPTFTSQAQAIEAIRFERKLEFGMEGQRFFDLVRWHLASQAGDTALPFDMVEYLNSEYLAEEKTKRYHLAEATFNSRNMYAPIPEYVITQSTVGGVRNIEQNDGF